MSKTCFLFTASELTRIARCGIHYKLYIHILSQVVDISQGIQQNFLPNDNAKVMT